MKRCGSAEMLFDYLLELREQGIDLNDVVVVAETTKHVTKDETYHMPSVNYRYLPAGHTASSVWEAEAQLVVGVGRCV